MKITSKIDSRKNRTFKWEQNVYNGTYNYQVFEKIVFVGFYRGKIIELVPNLVLVSI